MKTFVATAAAAVLLAWTAAAQDEPKVGAFLGYDYVRFSSGNNNNFNAFNNSVDAFSANGGSGQFIVKFNHWLGAVLDLGAVANGNNNGIRADTTIANFLAGPRVTFARHRSRFQPYAQVLFGGVWATTSTQISGLLTSAIIPPPPVTILPGLPITASVGGSQTAFALTAGGGLDIRVTRHLTFRPIALDYLYTRLSNFRAFGDNSQNSIRYSTGLALWFGGEKPAPVAHRQQMKTCPNGAQVDINASCPKLNFSASLTATPADLCPGDTARFTPSFSGVSPKQLTFSQWSVNGQPVSQTGSYEFNSAGMAPGTYTVKLTTGGDAFNPESAETTVTVHEYQPPTGTVQANPALIHAGDKSAVSSNFTGQCGGPIQAATYEASEGAMQGDQFDSSSIQWDASNNSEQKKTVTITAKAADNKSVGTATTTIDVVKSAVIMPVRLPDLLFPANSSRVNNCAKRILLEQLRAYYERDSSGTVVLSGFQSADEKGANLAQQRAMNAAAVVTAGTGVCLSIPETQVQVSSPGVDQNGVPFEAGFCRSSVGPIGPETDMRRVAVWFVPSGGQIPASVTNSQSASTLSVSRLGCPK
jgi:opacity protein-like surface antigen